MHYWRRLAARPDAVPGRKFHDQKPSVRRVAACRQRAELRDAGRRPSGSTISSRSATAMPTTAICSRSSALIRRQLPYSTGRFSGGTNYIDTLGQLLNAPIDNFAIGGALTDNTNTNGPGLARLRHRMERLPGAAAAAVFPTVSGTFDENDLLAVSIGGNDARFYQQTGGNAGRRAGRSDRFRRIRDRRPQRAGRRRRAEHQLPCRQHRAACRRSPATRPAPGGPQRLFDDLQHGDADRRLPAMPPTA